MLKMFDYKGMSFDETVKKCKLSGKEVSQGVIEFVGKNPFEIEKHWHSIYRDAYWRGGAVLMSALSAVEMALWDILEKSLNVPVYQLLGGKVNDKVRIYVNGWFAGAK